MNERTACHTANVSFRFQIPGPLLRVLVLQFGSARAGSGNLLTTVDGYLRAGWPRGVACWGDRRLIRRLASSFELWSSGSLAVGRDLGRVADFCGWK